MAAVQCHYCAGPISQSSQFCPNCSQPLVLHGYYRLLGVLGQGGFGVVYEAIDTRLGRRCAIKAVASVSLIEQQHVLAEARLLGKYAARFSFIPDVYDIWSETGRTYMVMRYIDGSTLDQMLGQPWPAEQVEDFLRTLLDYLAQIHAADIIHRDLKPQNIKYTPQGQYVLLDFGIAKQGAATVTSIRALSPDYAPAEQVRGAPTDARSDLYSLGATAYHLLTGHLPANVTARLGNGAALIPPSALVFDVPPALEHALLRMLELDPDARPAHARAALQLLNTPPSIARAIGATIVQPRPAPRPRLPDIPPVLPSSPRVAPAPAPRPSPGVARPRVVPILPPRSRGVFRSRAAWKFWFQWVIASVLSAIIGIPLTVAVAMLVLSPVQRLTDLIAGGVLLGALFGGSLGAAQWSVLRYYLHRAGWWVPATVLGWAVGLAGMITLADTLNPPAMGIAGALALGATLGAIVGVAQWLLLRRQVHNAGVWIIASALSLALVLALLNTAGPDIATVVVRSAEALIAPFAISGAALIWMLRRTAV